MEPHKAIAYALLEQAKQALEPDVQSTDLARLLIEAAGMMLVDPGALADEEFLYTVATGKEMP